MHCDFAFYMSAATHENAAELPVLEQHEGVCGVKVFHGLIDRQFAGAR